MRIGVKSLIVLTLTGMAIGIGALAYAGTALVTAVPAKRTASQAQKRAKKLKKALKACNKKKSKAKRKKCKAAARKKYGPHKKPGPRTRGTTTGTTGTTTGTHTTATTGATTATTGPTTGTGGTTTGTTQETLTVTVSSTSEGSVSGTGGINCPGTCTAIYAYGTQVTLTANPDSGFVLSGWSGACSGTATCVVTMNSAENVTASFSVPPFTAATPGSYSGSDTTNVSGDTGRVTFYISPDGSAIQDLQASDYEVCSPSGSTITDRIEAASIPIESNGTFSYTSSSTGVFENTPATFNYSFSGKFNAGSFSGQLTETVAYGGITKQSCTTALQTWSATHESSQGTQTAAPAQAGSYSGSVTATNVGGSTGHVSFYVSPEENTIQDLEATNYQLCTPIASTFTDKIEAASIPIQSNGSFTYTSSSTGVFENTPATFNYTFAGHLHGLTSSGEQRVAGQLTETVTYGSGTTYNCTSDLQSWSATRESGQGTQTNAPAEAGSYSGSVTATNVGGDAGKVTFYVSPDGSTIQDLEATNYQLCVPSASTFLDKIEAASIPLESNGSFTYSGSTTGVYENTPATFNYAFAGHLHGLTSAGETRVAGQLTESVTYGNGTTHTCTSDPQSWSATRQSSQGTQTNQPAQAGSYSGSVTATDVGGDTGSVSFYVSPNQSTIQDLEATNYQLCSPIASTFEDKIQAASIPLESNGSFSFSGSSTGVYENTPATFNYSFVGHLHGLASSGEQRMAGQLTETVAWGSATKYSCTSDLQSWSATRESSESTQTYAPAQAGSYSGSATATNVGGDTGKVTFYISPEQNTIQDLEATTYELCVPSASTFGDKIEAASIPIESNGSFSYSGSSAGVFENTPATFNYTFVGHLHGLASSGQQRMAGQLTETVTYGSGTTRSCTSDLQSWSATRESSQSTQTNAAAQAGSYSGSATTTNVGGNTGHVTFYVSPDETKIQDLVATNYQLCIPAATFADKIEAASIPIESNGAFSYSGSSAGVYENTAATFNYTFVGHLHGLASSGEQRMAGQLTETVTYGSSGQYSCTSDLQSWSATRESSQSTQTNAPAQAGSYLGSVTATNVGGSTGHVAFSVPSGAAEISNLEVKAYELCLPSASTFLNAFTVASIPIESNGSFSYSGSESGTVGASPATLMLTFEGHLHGLNSSGYQRVAGELTETVTYASGTTYNCTSDLQSWSATN